MKVTEVEELLIDEIHTDEGDSPVYRRISADTWENLISGSWDPVSWHGESRTGELEIAYQTFLREEHERVVAAIIPRDPPEGLESWDAREGALGDDLDALKAIPGKLAALEGGMR